MGNADSFTKAKADIEVPRGRHILRPSTDPRSEPQAVRPGDTPPEPGHTLGRETPPDPQGSADSEFGGLRQGLALVARDPVDTEVGRFVGRRDEAHRVGETLVELCLESLLNLRVCDSHPRVE